MGCGKWMNLNSYSLEIRILVVKELVPFTHVALLYNVKLLLLLFFWLRRSI